MCPADARQTAHMHADIEDITSKTGNFKKFAVFVKMLLSALKQASDSVFVDLLTYQDLELLKSRKAGGQAPPPRTQPPNNKRYLIMTYAAEFDRVHYPLPLLYEEHPDPQHLKRIISQLRSEVEALQLEAGSRSGSQVSAELRRLREENSSLRQQIKQLERSGVGPAAPGAGGESGELTRELRVVSSGCVPSHVRYDGQEVQPTGERAYSTALSSRLPHLRLPWAYALRHSQALARCRCSTGA